MGKLDVNLPTANKTAPKMLPYMTYLNSNATVSRKVNSQRALRTDAYWLLPGSSRNPIRNCLEGKACNI